MGAIQRNWTSFPLVTGPVVNGDAMKLDIHQTVSFIVLGLVSWGALQLYQMNANLSLVTYKVEENHAMIKPMWQDFLIRKAKYDVIPITDVETNIHASNKETN
jgi:hypothetical protein|tara:strand:+ start:272 stop:580 length:309 start_codon:yes stop_codon:yes gene_type:complete